MTEAHAYDVFFCMTTIEKATSRKW